MSIDPAVVKQQVSTRVAVLRRRPYDELEALPGSASEDVVFGRPSVIFQTLREGHVGDDVTIIGQCFRDWPYRLQLDGSADISASHVTLTALDSDDVPYVLVLPLRVIPRE